MKYIKIKLLLSFLLLFSTKSLFAQFTVNYNLPSLIGFNYEFNAGFIPEVRIGTNTPIDVSNIEALLNYGFIKKPEYTFYAGIGLDYNKNQSSGLIPIGVNIYPFEKKAFGFQMETGPELSFDGVFRIIGRAGIRYRFLKNE